MSEKEKFENEFEKEITDLLVLTKTSTSGGAVVGNFIRPVVYFVASVNLQTGEFSHESGILTWMTNRNEENWGYDFQSFEIYHIQARKSIPVVLQEHTVAAWNHRYLVCKVMKKNVSDPRLDAMQARLKQPIVIEDAMGKFFLNRQFSCFESDVDWLGTSCNVLLNTDEEDGETAEKALEKFHMLYADLTGWDHRFRAYAAEKLVEGANDWLQDELEEGEEADPITEEDFARRIVISMIAIEADGSITVYYDDDDMFWGHTIVVSINQNGEMTDADIAG
ncbi:MAG: DUF2262 domain-containing protein [Oscillospiraceae bacterium]|nr:DUF2262 domain-containing protein [Oscillospiraceae bacterium]MDY2509505.1 DUF2262 domain-containing protein [Ruminococcus callidus]